MADHRVFCKVHGTPGLRIDDYDSYACLECGEWLDKVCGDPDCFYCGKRPERPSEEPS